MDRPALDAFARQQRLTPAAIKAALQATGLRPGRQAWRALATTLLRATGIGAISAGILFFVAANWQDCGVLGRFGLLQTVLLACIGVALWRAPPARAGQGALVLATLVTGGLLALFGQSYQTGADAWELFISWAALALPFAIAGLSGPLWAVWWAVLNTALTLLCGTMGMEHFVWRLLDGRAYDRSTLLMLPCLVNFLGAAGFLWVRSTRFVEAAPAWLVRTLASLGFIYGTLAVMTTLSEADRYRNIGDPSGAHAAVGLAFTAVSAGIGFATWRAKRDVFPMALIATAWIAISTTWLIEARPFKDVGLFLFIALWLICASSAACIVLMRWVSAWQPAPGSATEASGA